jgi:hypothetical protein
MAGRDGRGGGLAVGGLVELGGQRRQVRTTHGREGEACGDQDGPDLSRGLVHEVDGLDGRSNRRFGGKRARAGGDGREAQPCLAMQLCLPPASREVLAEAQRAPGPAARAAGPPCPAGSGPRCSAPTAEPPPPARPPTPEGQQCFFRFHSKQSAAAQHKISITRPNGVITL